ncbi:MAG: aminopeptidase P family protein [Pseudomonadota bacterium]
MYQSFDATTRPEDGPPRLAALRAEMARQGVDAFVVPRADAHRGEYVAACDDRLAWLTGFTGSAGFAVITADEAAVFVDGRYTVQVRAQVDTDHFTPVGWPKVKLTDWLDANTGRGDTIALDPWLHSKKEVEELEKAGLTLAFTPNLVDAIWKDRPAPPRGKVTVYHADLAGKSHDVKRSELGALLEKTGPHNAILTLPDSIAWLLNIRGSDLHRIPTLRAFAILNWTDQVQLFTDADIDDEVRAHLGAEVEILPYDGLLTHLEACERTTFLIDDASAPHAIEAALRSIGDTRAIKVAYGRDPCVLPKARKTDAEIAATTQAHLRDGAAMAEFLCWLDGQAATLVQDPAQALTEIDIVRQLETCRRDTGALLDISFDTISGAGPNGAIVHYRVTEDTNRALSPGELLLVDSGGQYRDGTTDITRTIAIGTPGADEIAAFTRVLEGMIAVSRARWPKGLAGRDLDALARAPLWMAGQDYDHGTGHGVGVYLSVHEGPQGLSRRSHVPLEPGMIVSNEPGYYREGAFGIRIENLVVVEPAPALGDNRDHLAFRTLTYAPIDRRLIDVAALSPDARDWLNAYHARVNQLISPRVTDTTRAWLELATQPV